MFIYNDRKEVIKDLEKIQEKVDEELSKEGKVNGNKVTKLLFQQLMVGLHMQQFPE